MDAAHLRIAITTNSLVAVDANFASAKQMVFYDVTRDAPSSSTWSNSIASARRASAAAKAARMAAV